MLNPSTNELELLKMIFEQQEKLDELDKYCDALRMSIEAVGGHMMAHKNIEHGETKGCPCGPEGKEGEHGAR